VSNGMNWKGCARKQISPNAGVHNHTHLVTQMTTVCTGAP